VVDIAYKELKIAILLECQVKFLFLSKNCHMFTKAICKNYAISAFPGYPGTAASNVNDLTDYIENKSKNAQQNV
jgi:hypothetical protein